MRWTDSAMFSQEPLNGVYSGITRARTTNKQPLVSSVVRRVTARLLGWEAVDPDCRHGE